MQAGWSDPPLCGSADRRWRAKSPTPSLTSSLSMRPHARCWWGTGGSGWCAVWSSWGSWHTSLCKNQHIHPFFSLASQRHNRQTHRNLHVSACLVLHSVLLNDLSEWPCKFQQLCHHYVGASWMWFFFTYCTVWFKKSIMYTSNYQENMRHFWLVKRSSEGCLNVLEVHTFTRQVLLTQQTNYSNDWRQIGKNKRSQHR